MKENIYKDLDLNFDINPLTGDIAKKKGVAAIRDSLKNILLYNIFEKPYSTQFDIGIRNLLFENKGKAFETYLRSRINILIKSYEPRVVLNDVIVKSGPDENSVEVSIYYTPKETQTQDTLELFLGKYNG